MLINRLQARSIVFESGGGGQPHPNNLEKQKKKKILIHRALPDATYLLDVSFSYFIILGNSIRAYFYAWKLFYTN